MANQVLYGFMNRRDLLDQRVSDSNIQEFNNAIDETLAEHQRQFDTLFGLFCNRTTQAQARYTSAVLSRNQPLDENGRARPIKRAGYYDVGFPVQHSGAAWGANFITRAKMTGAEVQRILATLINGDIRWMRDHILAALFKDASWTFPDPLLGNITVQSLANGDSVKYQIMRGADSGATDDHIQAQSNAIDNSYNPFNDIYDDLIEHPENGGEIISFIPTNVKAAVTGLTYFYDEDDKDITQGSGATRLTGRLDVAVPGTVLGKTDKVWIVEWPALPDGYIISVATEGDRPLAFREEPEAELQGFRRVADRNDYPYYESQYIRLGGFGAQNRVAARVDYVGVSGTYAIPTGYETPMP